MIDENTQHSEGMYRGGPRSRKRRILIFIIIYIISVVMLQTVFSGGLGRGHILFGVILTLLIRDDINELRAQDVKVGIIRFLFYILTIIIPISSLGYMLYRNVKIRSTN